MPPAAHASQSGGPIPAPATLLGLARRDWVHLGLLWLGGFDLRVTLLAVPPVIPAIHHQLGLSEKAVGVLTGLPVLLLAAVAIPGALLIARLGARRALVAGLVVVAAGAALRGVGPSTPVLFAMTFVMGAGVAVSQPAFPTLTREWFPARVAVATAVYSNGMLFGEMVPASVTGPLVVPWLHGSWPLSLAVWAAPVALAAALLLLATPHLPPHPEESPRRWWPDFGSRSTWQIGLVLGCASATYFGANTFLPDFVRVTGRPDLKDAALAALNGAQLAASLLVVALPRLLVRRRWPLAATAFVILAATLGLIGARGPAVIVCAAFVGFAAALTLVLTLALPPLLAGPGDVHRFSAGIFVIVYASSFAGPVLGGAAWDATGSPGAAFAVLAGAAALMAALALTLPLHRPQTRDGG